MSIYFLMHFPGDGSDADEGDDSWMMEGDGCAELRVAEFLITVTQLHLHIN